MRRIKQIFLSVLILASCALIPVSALDMDPVTSDKSMSGQPVEIQNYDACLDVRENGYIDVSLSMDVFYQSRRQGIFVVIPEEYKDYSFKEGVKQDFTFPVTNINVEGYEYDVDKSDGAYMVRIGSKGEYLEGLHNYKMTYTIRTKDLGLEDRALFYQNILSNKWDVPIMRTTVTVNMPKPFEYEPQFYATSQNKPVDWVVEGNTIKAVYDDVLDHESFTVLLRLPKDYYTYPVYDYTWYAMGFSLTLLVLVGVLYFRYGKDETVVPTVEFTAPNGISSAEVGYIYRGQMNQKDIISLIIYWASKGYLRIEEHEDDTIELIKLNNLKSGNPEEVRLFKSLFTKERVTLKSLENSFYTHVQFAQDTIPNRFKKSKDNKIFYTQSFVIQGILFFIVPLMIALVTATVFFADFGLWSDFGVALLISYGLTMPLTIIALGLFGTDKINPSKHKVVLGFVFVLLSVLKIGVLIIMSSVYRVSLVPAIVSYVAFIVALYFLANMGKRTPYGVELLGKILGLKAFIEVAEQSRLEALAESSPEIFYDILPYAYVLDITNVWIKKFERIAIPVPDWYVSSNMDTFTTFYLWSSLNRSLNTMSHSMTVAPAPSSFTSSSGGGGSFGGGGGGGFSGGGFGGTGGGSW